MRHQQWRKARDSVTEQCVPIGKQGEKNARQLSLSRIEDIK